MGISGKRIDDYKSFLYWEKRNKEAWKERWKQRKGKETARGWNESPEWKKYEKQRKARLRKYYGRNPQDFVEKSQKFLEVIYRQSERYADIEVYNALLEVYSDLSDLEVTAFMSGWTLKASLVLKGLYVSGTFFGMNSIKRALMDEIAEWRNQQDSLSQDDSFVVEMSGTLDAIATQNGVMTVNASIISRV